MSMTGYILETVEEISLEVNVEENELNDYEQFGSFEIDPLPDEDIYIPGSDEKIN